MSVYAGPEISQSGLVFAYDMGNTDKSWRGKPTTNHIPNAAAFTGWSNYYRTIQTTSFTTEFGTTGWRFIDQPSWSGLVTSYTVPSTGTYTFSAYYKYLGGSASNNGGSVYINGWGGADTLVALNKSLIGVWQRVQITLNLTNLSGLIYLISFGGIDNGTTSPDNTSFEVTMPMIESGSFATPFVDGTRSNTQAILDLIGLNTITATSLTYNSNNTFRFAGSDSIATTYVPINTAGSISVWFKINAHKDYNTIFDNALGANDWEFWVYSTGVARFRSTADNGDYILDSDVLLTGIYYNFVITWTNTTATLYKNGVFMSQDTTSGTKVTPGVMYFGGGNAGNTKLDGDLPCAFAYNRALSAAEIQQNFNALRGRFGI